MSKQGLPVVMRASGERGQLDRDVNTVTGQAVWQQTRAAEVSCSFLAQFISH